MTHATCHVIEKVSKHATPHLVLKSFWRTLSGGGGGGRGDDIWIVPASDESWRSDCTNSLYPMASFHGWHMTVSDSRQNCKAGTKCMQRSFSNWKHSHHFHYDPIGSVKPLRASSSWASYFIFSSKALPFDDALHAFEAALDFLETWTIGDANEGVVAIELSSRTRVHIKENTRCHDDLLL